MNQYNPQKHHRRSVRLRGYDYAQPGAYFVTTCVRDGACILGDIVDGCVQETEYGRIAHDFWAQVPVRFPNVTIDTFVVMPNHVHAIVVINEPAPTGGMTTGGITPPLQEPAHVGGITPPLREPAHVGGITPPLQESVHVGGITPPLQESVPIQRPTLGQIVGFYKYQTTVQINEVRDAGAVPFWQRSFYDHIIRNQRDLDAIREYILNNPLKWDLDRDNPANARIRPRQTP